jgi:hypothetical protein
MNSFKQTFIILFLVLLISCSASKKNVSIQKTKSDSTATLTKKETRAITSDIRHQSSDLSQYTKETEITYVPIEMDSQNVQQENGNGVIIINSPKPGKKIILVPSIKIRETGQNNIHEETSMQKKDTLAKDLKTEVAVKKESKIIEKKKLKFHLNPLWLLLLLPLLLLSKRVRNKFISIFKKLFAL